MLFELKRIKIIKLNYTIFILVANYRVNLGKGKDFHVFLSNSLGQKKRMERQISI